MRIRNYLASWFGFAILIGAMGYSVFHVAWNHLTYETSDAITVKMCHWQLEGGFREAMDDLIRRYEEEYAQRTGKRLRIVQMPILERGYSQFLNTGLIGGVAPDIVEMGMARTANDPAYIARFFRPLGARLNEPNRHNAGGPLEGLPWRETFFDGMQGAYNRVLLDYYYIPLSMYTVRLYYNADLYREITGHDDPPKSFGEFLDVCRRAAEHRRTRGGSLVAMAGSKYQARRFESAYEVPFLFDMIQQCDTNFDGIADRLETCLAWQRGDLSFTSPRLLASWACLAEIAQHFQDGWMAAQRDDAVFMFVQGRALMIASGSWDAQSIIAQVAGVFRVGVCDFPMPTDHPVYGQYVRGPASEADIRGSLPLAITRQSRHPEICIDFLRFCTTQANNERLNQRITWLPVIRGAQLSERLMPFKPKVEGFSGKFEYDISPAVRLISAGNRYSLYEGRMSPEEYAGRLTEVYERTVKDGFREHLDRLRRNGRNLDRTLSVLMLARNFRVSEDAAEAEEKIIQVLQSGQDYAHQAASCAVGFQAPGRDAEGGR